MPRIAHKALSLVLGQYLPTSPPERVEVVLARYASALMSPGDLRDSDEVVEEELHDFLTELRHHWNECAAETGRYCPFEFSALDDKVLQGCAWISENDLPSVREQRALLAAQFSPLLQAIRNMDPDDFEALGAGILNVLGVRSAKATTRSRDEGIDFFGRLRMSDFMLQHHALPNVERQLEVWIIGQAKRYVADPVGTASIRELVGSCELARAGIWPIRATTYSPAIQIRQLDPVYALMITCGQFSGPAWKLMRAAGVVGMDGPMLAQMLALEGQLTDAETGAFDPVRFGDWLDGQERLV